jgi:hypothetical protein
MMPTQEDEATRRFFVEALRANTDTMKALREDIREEREERKEDRKLLNDIHTRVVKIEANRLDRQVEQNRKDIVALRADHGGRIDALEKAEDRREGQVSAANTAHKWAPTILALLFILIALALTGVVPT